jgi:hypothetical protein
MKSLVGIAVCFLALSGIASAQAAVEGALTHGLSGAASASAGKALGQIGNQLAGRLGQQTSNTVRPAVTPALTTVRPGAQKIVKVPATVTTPVPGANGGSLIASIQGAEPQQAKACSTPDQKQNQCVGTNAADKDSHPAEITLPAAK